MRARLSNGVQHYACRTAVPSRTTRVSSGWTTREPPATSCRSPVRLQPVDLLDQPSVVVSHHRETRPVQIDPWLALRDRAGRGLVDEHHEGHPVGVAVTDPDLADLRLDRRLR